MRAQKLLSSDPLWGECRLGKFNAVPQQCVTRMGRKCQAVVPVWLSQAQLRMIKWKNSQIAKIPKLNFNHPIQQIAPNKCQQHVLWDWTLNSTAQPIIMFFWQICHHLYCVWFMWLCYCVLEIIFTKWNKCFFKKSKGFAVILIQNQSFKSSSLPPTKVSQSSAVNVKYEAIIQTLMLDWRGVNYTHHCLWLILICAWFIWPSFVGMKLAYSVRFSTSDQF